MAFSTATRVKSLLRQLGSSSHQGVDDTAITNAVNFSNEYLIKLGVDSSTVDEGLNGIADQLALAYLAEGIALTMLLRGEIKTNDQLRRYATAIKRETASMVNAYIPLSLRGTTIERNLSFDQ